jgi:hypothetical protein
MKRLMQSRQRLCRVTSSTFSSQRPQQEQRQEQFRLQEQFPRQEQFRL